MQANNAVDAASGGCRAEAKRVLLVEDHPLCRVATKWVLDPRGTDTNVREVDTVAAALDAMLEGPAYDLVVYDWTLRGSGGVKGLIAICQMAPHTPVVVVSGNDDEAVRMVALDVGAAAFVLKTEAPAVLCEVLRRCLKLAPQALPAEVQPPPFQPVPRLTRRQQAVLRAMAEGHGNKTIAKQLDIAGTTVRTHVSEILRLFGVHNRTEAVVTAQKAGLLESGRPV
jgi:DNA-binding NarL/FixJ family response regulator